MCKCCQLCLEDLYWMCWEEKHGYDENIANYDPSEDEYARKNGHVMMNGGALENNNQPVTSQPTRMQRNISLNSSKIHEDEFRREIQVASVNLAPEILQVFANSQIFHDHKPLKIKPTTPQPATFSLGSEKIDTKEITEDKLLERLEEAAADKKSTSSSPSSPMSAYAPRQARIFTTPPRIIETPAINEEEGEDEASDEIDEVVLRPRQLQPATSSDDVWPTTIVNKNLKNLHLDSPYFTHRPASENDIFTISTPKKSGGEMGNVSSTLEMNRFSMTPEVPSISFSHLPKNYLDTPSIDRYRKEPPTLLQIQTAELRNSMIDFSMPRYYGKSDFLNLNRSFDVAGSANSIASSVDSNPSSHHQNSTRKQHHGEAVVKNKRLKKLRAHLPPLTIHSMKEKQHEKQK